MKKIFLIWISFISLSFASTPFTLSEIDELHIVLDNSSKMVDKKTELILKQMMEDKLKSLGVKTDTFSGESFVLMIGQNEFGDMKFLNIKLMVIAQVKRAKAKESTLGVIYMMDDLFDTTDPNVDMIDSLEFLLSEFSDQFVEDSAY